MFLGIPSLKLKKLAPVNRWLEDEISLWDGLFSGAMLVSGSVCVCLGVSFLVHLEFYL